LSAADFDFAKSQPFLKQYCENCHGAKMAAGGFRLERISTESSMRDDAKKWLSLAGRVRNGEMPPKGSPAPSIDQRESFYEWVEAEVHRKACSDGVAPGPSPMRRLNRDEYAATLRDLLDMHMDIAQALPADGAGGEGFDNAAETLFLSPLHAEKYMDLAKFAMDFAAKEFKSRTKILIAQPGPNLTQEQAARKIFANFLPRAFRRPITNAEIAPYMDLFQAARAQGQPFEEAIFFSLRGALVSPFFLFRTEPPNATGADRPLDGYSLANRLSYFLWGSMPDELLFDVAKSGKLHDPEVLQQLIRVMLRSEKSRIFAQRFTEQWLHTRELSGDKAPDAKLYPAYAADEELRSDIRLQPAYFFREIFLQNRSLLDFIDSNGTISTSNLVKHYGVKMQLRQNAAKQPHWVTLPENSRRGGLLGMASVLSVSSYPYRTSPVLRGAWILDALLGTPPPSPPANVPPLEESAPGAAPKSVRERLTQHRANAVCASCHNRIDPWGFALENYDPIGRWREEDAGKPIDTTAELTDGTKFKGPDALRTALLERKDLFVRNLTRRMLGYALGRGLTLKDSCTLDAIAAKVKENNYSAMSLLEQIVLSVPFRMQAPQPSIPRKDPAKS
jgi:mono/diheme cytochrome c family protein